MSKKPTYEELLQKVNSLEKEIKRLKPVQQLPSEIEYLKHLVKFAPYGMFLIDLSSSGKIIACNDKGAERLGSTTDKVIGTVLKDHFPPDAAKERQLKGFEAIETEKPVTFEDQIKDRYYYNMICPIVNDQGKIDKLAIYGTDITDIKKIEDKMFESEERYKAIFDRSLDCFFVSDFEGNFLDANKSAVNLLGYSREEITSLNYASLLSEDQLPISFDAIKEIMETGAQKDPLELRLLKKNGEIAYIESLGSLIYHQGKPHSIQGIARDISERKESENELRESEEKYRTILSNIEEGYYEVDLAGNLMFFNDSLSKILGYKKKELMGMNNRAFMNLETSRQVFNIFNTVYKTQKTAKAYNWELITKSGLKCFVEISIGLIKDAKGGPSGFRGIVRDVTERKRSENELKLSLQTSDDIVKAIPSGLFIYQFEKPDKLYLIHANPEAEKFTGLNAEDWIGKEFNEIWPEAKKSGITESFLTPMKTGNMYETEELFYKDQRLEGAFRVRTFKMPGSRLGVAFENISEKKRLEAQFYQAQKMEAIGTLAGGIAHDFNNLLMAILGRNSLMMTDLDPSHPHFIHLTEMETCVKSAADLTNQLLGFARGGKYEAVPVDINELIRKHNQMFGRTKKEIKTLEKYENKIWPVEVDKGQINQVLMNIYVNAWQAMPDGGELFVSTENSKIDQDYAKPFEVSPGKYVKISITDTGIGMNSMVKDKIFDPFFTTKEKQRGTGMGLSSAYGIIKNHRGFITVYSELGEGTTFNIYLPASKKQIKEEKLIKNEIVKGTGTILLVDDEQMIISVGEGILKKIGYDVLPAMDGKQAIDIYKKKKDSIDMVILDLIMPGMPGKETFEALTKINPDVKVLLASGYSFNGKAKQIIDQGASGFIQKPFNIEQLSLKIKEVLEKQ